ncbi:response regulator transcription factor [Clostridium sp. CF011]|uniref:response regulator transcription factor n=1 Tax=unclassified Clostridium TaxID=2614128 RepID=UPI001C0D5C7E|nr:MULTISPECIES: response regulator transcription factor [unclassified Clostridium]MBU3092532.1 response regulator transcription factor [Clostridium sp. CF011]MBW9146351.1 response regulator transcription factor [Clostridium sp. CM027]UVE39863.1 response regulator transcription factor [Clostridium sp. CM027]WAG68779.1 response regulator transcription factor [Clostridium sp. CF011]
MNDNISVLVVEDDIDINNLLCGILSKHGYYVKTAYSGSEARMCINQYDFHIILLDLMIPGISGEELISIIRKIKTMPIIVLSAKTAQDTKIEVLRLGADDFVSKPFDVNEILARVESQLRRYMIFSNKSKSENILKYKDLILNSEAVEALVKGENINITPREFHILEMLMSYPNKVFTKANIFETVWNDEFFGDDNTVNVHVSNLRSKIAKIDPDSEYIHTVWGIGYKMS